MLKTQQLKDICTAIIHETRKKEMLEIKSKTTVQWLPETGALCLLQPIQRAVTRLEIEQSSHRLISKCKIQWGAYKTFAKEVSTEFTKWIND